MYVIMGASGNTGKPLTMALLKAGKKVRILSRSEEKVKELKAAGAEVMVGDSNDAGFLTKAFTGATAAYVMIPPNWAATDFTDYQRKYADTIAEAVKKSGVKFVVSLSSVGTHLEEHSGVVFGLRYMEQKLDAIPGINTLHLRPTYFMENTFGQIGVIKQMGIMGSPVEADLVLSMIATKDIA
nr:NmrA family NAD(P)-binding protein [Ignavibacteriaceae bacterium]